MHQPSVSRYIIPLKFSYWNIICFWQKQPINAQYFRLCSVLIKVHPIPHAIFESTKLGFVQILHHCSVSWKMTPLYFFSWNHIYFGQKRPMEVKFLVFWVIRWKFTKLLMPYFRPQVRFSLNFASVFRGNSSVLFQLKLYIIFTKV